MPAPVPDKLATAKCQPCAAGARSLTDQEADALLGQLSQWSREGSCIVRTYRFSNYHETMAFVNAAAWISHREDHHPDLLVGYKQCRVVYTTHAVSGLSRNDFICAAKVDALFTL